MKKKEWLEFEQIKKTSLEQLRSGKWLYGLKGCFAPLLKSFFDSPSEAKSKGHSPSDTVSPKGI